MAELRVKAVAAAKGYNMNQLYQAVNTARAQRGEKFIAMGTVRRYWHSTEKGYAKKADKPLDQISWSFLQELADVMGVSVYALLPEEDGLGNTLPTPRKQMQAAA